MFKKIAIALALFVAMTSSSFAHSLKYVDHYYPDSKDYYKVYNDDYDYYKFNKKYKYDYDDVYYYNSKYYKNDYYYDYYKDDYYRDNNYYDLDVVNNRVNNFDINLALDLDDRHDYIVQPFIYDVPVDDFYLWTNGFGYPSYYKFFQPFYYHSL